VKKAAVKLAPDMAALAALGKRKRFSGHSLLIQEGETGDTLYVIISGQVRVFASDHHNKEVTLGMFGPGDYVGEMSLDGGPRSASVETLVPTVCAMVSKEALRQHIAQHPDFALKMMSRLIGRTRRATENLRSLALMDTAGRSAMVLENMAVMQPDGTHLIPERITHAQLASQVVCSREMVSRLLKELERGGFMTLVDRRMVLLKPLPGHW
jgi:CRP/FNR family cyclic AMP-dependent transcriptional regulator